MKYSKEATKHINNLYARIVELEKERDALLSRACQTCRGVGAVGNILEAQDCPECSAKEQAYNLEQQAKGIDWVLACRELNLSEGEVHTLMDKYKQLREGVINE